MIYNTLLDENFPTCIRAVFEHREAAEAAAGLLKRITGVEVEQLRILTPRDSSDVPTRGAGIDRPGSRRRALQLAIFVAFVPTGSNIGLGASGG